jgi:hypothetical protein
MNLLAIIRHFAIGMPHPMEAPGRRLLGITFSIILVTFGFCQVSRADLVAAGIYPVATNPIAVAIGDFDVNGKPDLVVANQGSDNISVVLGNGDGSFQPATNYAVGFIPQAVGVGDFDGDGKPDVAVANNFAPSSVSVLLGNGDGTLQAAVNYPTADNPTSLVIGDFNGDQKPDIALSSGYTDPGTVTILLGNGDGTFLPSVTFSAGRFPYAMASGDFNRDNKLDLVIANNIQVGGALGGSVTLLPGKGDGTFDLGGTNRMERSPGSIIVADFNQDGMLDVATGNDAVVGSASILLGNGDGTFQPRMTYGTSPNPQSLAVTDCNLDGVADLAVVDYEGVSVLPGLGEGMFDLPLSYVAGYSPISIVAGDFNADTKPDFAVANYDQQGAVSILLNNSHGIELRIEHDSTTTARVSWSYPAVGFVLEATTTLTSPNWLEVEQTPMLDGEFWRVTVPVESVRFFRLRKNN